MNNSPLRFRQPTTDDRPQMLIVVAIMVMLALLVGIVTAVMPARLPSALKR